MSKVKIMVAIPTINRADLLNTALIKYFEDFKNTEIVICDNGNQQIVTREKRFVKYTPVKNLGVSASWNMLMDYASMADYTHVLMLNDDIYLGLNEEQILLFIERNLDADFFCCLQNWCSFILPVKTFHQIGLFDENIYPAYFEDNDYHYRMYLAKIKMEFTAFLNPVVYRNSMTIAKDPSINSNFMKNREYYINKWGGLPSQEQYVTPFNR